MQQGAKTDKFIETTQRASNGKPKKKGKTLKIKYKNASIAK